MKHTVPNSTPLSAEVRLETLVRQQKAVVQLGILALSGVDIREVMDKAVKLVERTLDVEYVKVMELLPDGDALLLGHGVGWEAGAVGGATVGTHLESQDGYTLISDEPVICGDLHREIRFKGSPLLHDHGVVSGVTVSILAENRHYGVLGAHTTQLRRFSADEARFLRDVADVLGAAVSRARADERSGDRSDEHAERAEAAERRFAFLAEANVLLSASSTDLETTLRNIASLVVPAIADWCFVDLVEDARTVGRTVVCSTEVPNQPRRTRSTYTLDPNAHHGTSKVLRTGYPELLPEVDERALEAIAANAGTPEASSFADPGSFMCVPLRVRRRTLGAMGFLASTASRPPYGAQDLTQVEGLAHCAALAIENAYHHVPEARLVRELLNGREQSRDYAPAAPNEDAPDMTRRQLEVLRLLGEGRSAKLIARDLHLSEATVRNHIRAVKHALDARSQLEAIARARKLGFFSG